QDLAWGDYTFKVGGQLTAETESRVYELTYELAFLRRPNYEIVAIAGIHLVHLKLQLSGNASLPVFGFRGDWAVSPHAYLGACGEILSLSFEGISGNCSDLRAGATWMFSRHFGIGLGYERFVTHADVGKASFSGRLNFGYQGLLLYIRGGF